MQVIGITGSSGSGKTTMSEILNQRNDAKVIDVDKLAKRLTSSQTPYFLAIQEAFQNDDILLEDGSLNRRKLADLIYHNNSNLEKLNRITFQHLIPEIRQEIKHLPNNIKIVVIDAPLLFEAGLDKYCDWTVAMQAPINLKIERICKRDNISEKVAKARLEIQQTDEFYRKNADFVIENDENTAMEDLERQIETIIIKMSNKNI